MDKAWHRAHRRTPKGQFTLGKAVAKIRGYSWVLTLEEFTKLRCKPCHYCGATLSPTGSGLDRKDNSRGYELDNVVPCCLQCNRMKNEHLSYDEMILVMNYRRSRHG